MSEPRFVRPAGLAVTLDLTSDMGMPRVGFTFAEDEETAHVYILLEEEAEELRDAISGCLHRAAVAREMLTMFPEQADSILETLRFRWNEFEGMLDGDEA